jgi:hypothetical protein
MNHGIDAHQQFCHLAGVLEPQHVQALRGNIPAMAPGKIVDHHDLEAAAQQMKSCDGADISGASGHQNLRHRSSFYNWEGMQQVSRRQFAQVLAGSAAVFATGGPIVLEAIAAPQLPRRLLVHGLSTAAGLFEFRVYGSHPRAMPDILERHGIRPAWREHSAIGTAYLIPFESLEARQRAWDAFNADADWHTVRAGAQVNLKEISLYRLAG